MRTKFYDGVMSVDLKLMEEYFDRLWPICRSITGDGVRKTLDILDELIPLERHRVPSGTEVFDWTVPQEWNIREAYIVTPDGSRVADVTVNNLHVVNYSIPVDKELDWDELTDHIHTLPEQPEAIPYVTSYYNATWGFCLSYEEFSKLPQSGKYKVYIDSTLQSGELIYGECVIPGETTEEVLFSTYVCHPSMANNELSGPLVSAFLCREILAMPRRKLTYRFVFIPETIGAICLLDRLGGHFKSKLKAGYVLTCCGDRGPLTFKQSKLGVSDADRAMEHVLKFCTDVGYNIEPFSVGGSDERQYCSPGFNLPVASLMRTPYQRYAEYHTSLDNKDFISFSCMGEVVELYLKATLVLEVNGVYEATVKNCEPQLGKRGLYPSFNRPDRNHTFVRRMMHLLTFCDGDHDLISIAEKRSEYIGDYMDIFSKLSVAGLLSEKAHHSKV